MQLPSKEQGGGACPASATTGVLAKLSNVLGHFDVAVPPGGCSGQSGRLGSLVDISSSYTFGESAFNGADPLLIEGGAKEQLEARNHARFRSLLPRDGVSLEQWRKWLVQYQESDRGCVVAAGAGYFNLTSFACSGNLISSGRVVQTSTARSVNLGVRGNTLVVGYVSESEVKSTLNPFDALVAGSGWLVRNGASYIRESLTKDGEDISPLGTGIGAGSMLSQKMARSAVGYNQQGELLLLQTSETAAGLTLEEFAGVAVELGFEQAINLVGGGMANLAANHSIVSSPSSTCDEGEGDLLKCAQPVSTAACMHTLQPPINEAELEMVLPLGPGNGKLTPSTGGGSIPSPSPTHSPGWTAWPTFSWEKKDGGLDDDLPPPMLNGSDYSIAELRKELDFYKGSTVLATATCAFLLSILFYMCTHKVEREEVYTVQHGMDSSHGHHGQSGGHSAHSPVHRGAEAGIQFMQISEPQRRGPAPAGGVLYRTQVSLPRLRQSTRGICTSSSNSSKGVPALAGQDRHAQPQRYLVRRGRRPPEEACKPTNAKSKMTGKSRHKGLGKASAGKTAEPAKVVTPNAFGQGAAASKYQQLNDEDMTISEDNCSNCYRMLTNP